MRRAILPLLPRHLIAGAWCVAGALAPCAARAADNSRAVDVIDAQLPALSASTQAPTVRAIPSDTGRLALLLPPDLTARMPSGRRDHQTAAQRDSGSPEAGLKAANAAGLSVDILPTSDIPVGTSVSFRITTRTAGYLLLLDVDAAGKLTQIYPNPRSLVSAPGGSQRSNMVKPGKPVLIPDPTDAHAGFEFVAAPPQGTAMVVALLSDLPVQMIDLPDLPSNLLGQADALGHLSQMAHELRIASGEGGRLQQARWSLDAKFYSIR